MNSRNISSPEWVKLCYHGRPICSWTDQCGGNTLKTAHRMTNAQCPNARSSFSPNTSFLLTRNYPTCSTRDRDRRRGKKNRRQHSLACVETRKQHPVTESAVCILAQSSWRRVTAAFSPVVYRLPLRRRTNHTRRNSNELLTEKVSPPPRSRTLNGSLLWHAWPRSGFVFYR